MSHSIVPVPERIQLSSLRDLCLLPSVTKGTKGSSVAPCCLEIQKVVRKLPEYIQTKRICRLIQIPLPIGSKCFAPVFCGEKSFDQRTLPHLLGACMAYLSVYLSIYPVRRQKCLAKVMDKCINASFDEK